MTRSWSNETKHRGPSVSTGWLTTWHLSDSWVSQMKEGHPRKHELEAGTVTYGIKSSDGVVAAGMYQCARQQLEREWLILGKRGGHLRSRTLRNDRPHSWGHRCAPQHVRLLFKQLCARCQWRHLGNLSVKGELFEMSFRVVIDTINMQCHTNKFGENNLFMEDFKLSF